MKVLKKILVAIFVIPFIFVMSACGKKSDKKTQTPVQTPTEQTPVLPEDPQEETPEPLPEDPVVEEMEISSASDVLNFAHKTVKEYFGEVLDDANDLGLEEVEKSYFSQNNNLIHNACAMMAEVSRYYDSNYNDCRGVKSQGSFSSGQVDNLERLRSQINSNNEFLQVKITTIFRFYNDDSANAYVVYYYDVKYDKINKSLKLSLYIENSKNANSAKYTYFQMDTETNNVNLYSFDRFSSVPRDAGGNIDTLGIDNNVIVNFYGVNSSIFYEGKAQDLNNTSTSIPIRCARNVIGTTWSQRESLLRISAGALEIVEGLTESAITYVNSEEKVN